MLFRLLFTIWFLPLLTYAEPSTLEVIPLKYRSVEEVVPVLQPFLAKEGTLSGMNGQLIVRTTPANLEQLRKILNRIDTLPKRLRITVSQGEEGATEKQGGEVSGRLRSGGVELELPAGRNRDGASITADGARARVWSSESARQENVTQEIQVMEGKPAWIHFGQAVPLRERTVLQQGNTTRIVESRTYQDIGTGFYVLPRLNGNSVTLEISTQKQRLSGQPTQGYESQGLNTTLSAALGEWIDLGEAFNQQGGEEAGWIYGNKRMQSGQNKIRLKIEAIP